MIKLETIKLVLTKATNKSIGSIRDPTFQKMYKMSI